MPARQKVAAGSGVPIPVSEYTARRVALRQKLRNAVLVMEGNTEAERGELRGGFFQEPNFAWLSGWLEPGAALLLAPADEKHADGDLLFLPDSDATRRLWTGPALDASAARAAQSTGFGDVRRMAHWEETLRVLASRCQHIYCIPGSVTEQRLRQAFPFREVISVQPLLADARMRKSDREIAAIREAVSITIAGQRRAWRSLQQSSYEYEVAADLTHEFLRLGSERHAFAPIVACGANACVLHYSRNRSPLRKGELTILDTGAERAGYCGDLTRTIPVGGRFSKRQRALYDAVLAVQKAVIASVRPGVHLGRQIPGSIHQQALSLFAELPLGKGREPLSAAFPHGIGHHLGIEVHDAHEPHAALAPGMVITVEPGIYLPDEGIGIRIEDDVLVTATGCEVLSAALPKEVHEIEELCSP
ncbi:MAG: aminopeptidase P N-terminal domain-containing protein [Bryobacterales bacterium]|nr:aminopeptidase P N-terminal domain-containing protein [Bryobacterales bacterium]